MVGAVPIGLAICIPTWGFGIGAPFLVTAVAAGAFFGAAAIRPFGSEIVAGDAVIVFIAPWL